MTLPLNILLNDVPRLLTPADKVRKHYTVRRAPPRLLPPSPPHLFPLSFTLAVLLTKLYDPELDF